MLGASREEPFGGAARAAGAVHLTRSMLFGALQVSIQERHGKGTQVRDVHSQRTPLLAGIFFAAAPAGAGNLFLLLGVHGRASHNFNQKLIPGNSFLQFGPLRLSPAPAVGLEPRVLDDYPSTPETPRGDFRGEGRWRRYLGPPPPPPPPGRMAVGVCAESTRPLPPHGLIDAKSKPKAVLVLVSLRVTRGRGFPLGDKVFFLLQREATLSSLSAPPTDSQR